MLRKVFKEIRAAGVREGLRKAAAYAELKADIAVELAPKGRLGLGLQRASIVHDLAVELRDMAENGR